MVKTTLFGVSLLLTVSLSAQPFTKEIVQYANDGNRRALEALRSQSLNDEEKLIVSALLEIDGAVAARRYQSLIANHPSSPFVRLADSRLREYNLAVGGGYAASAPVASVSEPKSLELKASAPKPVESKPLEPRPSEPQLSDLLPMPVRNKTASSGFIRFTIQFGSFFSRAQAETLQKQLRSKVTTRIVELSDDSGRTAYKVRSESFYNSKSEAIDAAKKLNLDFYVVAE
ncbi:MAG: SPOR domain-containing protein [Chloroherpetonaceae bacterium]